MGEFSIKKTTEQFKNELMQIIPTLTVIGEYESNKKKIIVKDELGILYLSSPKNLLNGVFPSWKSAFDKNEWFLKNIIKKRGFRYDYSISKFKSTKAKINIICKKHGPFSQLVLDHFYGSNCPKCANEKRGWTYRKWIDSSIESSKFESYKVYLIRCWDDNEEFYKIGKTFVSLKRRFGTGMTKAFPYNWEVIKIITSDGKSICEIERDLQSINSKYEYIPNKEFNGDTECFYKYNTGGLDYDD